MKFPSCFAWWCHAYTIFKQNGIHGALNSAGFPQDASTFIISDFSGQGITWVLALNCQFPVPSIMVGTQRVLYSYFLNKWVARYEDTGLDSNGWQIEDCFSGKCIKDLGEAFGIEWEVLNCSLNSSPAQELRGKVQGKVSSLFLSDPKITNTFILKVRV